MTVHQRMAATAAAIFVALGFLAAVTKPHKPVTDVKAAAAEQLGEALAVKTDRIAVAFQAATPTVEEVPSIPVRVIPIGRSVVANPSAAPVRVAAALPDDGSQAEEERSRAVSVPEASVTLAASDVSGEAQMSGQRRHRLADICAAHGMRRLEVNHGRSWRCARR